MKWNLLNHGRKIINDLPKRWADGSGLCHELEPKREADSDRSNIGVFEAGLSAQRHGDIQQSPRNETEEISDALIRIAKEQGKYFSLQECENFGERKRQRSGESTVYLDFSRQRVIKVRNPMAKAPLKQLRGEDIIYEHLVHNMFFPNTKYELLRISEDVDGIRLVLSQAYIARQYTDPDIRLIEKHLVRKLGFRKRDKYFYGNQLLSITDVSPESDNVLFDGKTLYFIDPAIVFHAPAKEILAHYGKLLI